MNSPCSQCGEQVTPYVSQGAAVGDVQLCMVCVERAFGRKLRIKEWDLDSQEVILFLRNGQWAMELKRGPGAAKRAIR